MFMTFTDFVTMNPTFSSVKPTIRLSLLDYEFRTIKQYGDRD